VNGDRGRDPIFDPADFRSDRFSIRLIFERSKRTARQRPSLASNNAAHRPRVRSPLDPRTAWPTVVATLLALRLSRALASEPRLN
jgi:hypothetical protein